MLETNTSIYKKSPTDSTGLYSFMDLDDLVLQGCLAAFLYRQDV